MRKLLLVALIVLGAGCGSSKQTGMTVPYGSSSDLYDPNTPIVPYNPESDLSRMAKTEEKAKVPLKEDYKDIGPMPTTKWQFPGKLPDAELLKKKAVLETEKGVIEFEIFGDEAPLAASNFIYLAKAGYYNGLTFHRRVEGFVIQGGDPSGNGTGGPGYQFEDEPVKRKYDRGIVAMANAGPDTNGSQFFIMLADYPLPPSYTIFGKVTKGLEAVDAIKVGDKMTKVTIQ